VFCGRRSSRASGDGAHRSKNVGMSSKNGGENPPHRKSKVSWATKIVPGLAGPKASPTSFAKAEGKF